MHAGLCAPLDEAGTQAGRFDAHTWLEWTEALISYGPRPAIRMADCVLTIIWSILHYELVA